MIDSKKEYSLPEIDAEYIHYKDSNSRYIVCDVVKLESTGECMVVYKNMVTNERWVRPNSEFMGLVSDEHGEPIPRFKYFQINTCYALGLALMMSAMTSGTQRKEDRFPSREKN